MYCKECGAEIEDGKYCKECGTLVEPVPLKQKEQSNNGNPSKLEKDEILNFKAVTLMTALTLFTTSLLYAYTPNYALIIGCFVGGLITGRLFMELTNKTGLISVFVGFIIASIVFAILISY